MVGAAALALELALLLVPLLFLTAGGALSVLRGFRQGGPLILFASALLLFVGARAGSLWLHRSFLLTLKPEDVEQIDVGRTRIHERTRVQKLVGSIRDL